MSLFNLTKIYQQIDYNEEAASAAVVTKGNFQWENGIKDTRVVFSPNKNGNFYITWVPPTNLQNRLIIKNGIKYPGNEHMGAFGCDSYDISGTVDGKGSNGSLHGLTKFSMEDSPVDHFFLEYIARPQTAEIFFEDVLMACVFYGISSGLAIMACNKNRYAPVNKTIRKSFDLGIKRYDNKGTLSKIIK